MGWVPVPGADADAIHDNVAAEIDALTAVTPVAGDWLIGEDTSDSDNKKKFDATHFLGGGDIPEWIEYLAARQSDETAHADDDLFTSDSSADYTTQTVSGSAAWTISRGLLSVKFNSQTAGDLSAYLKAITSASAPITIEARMKSWTDHTASYDYDMGIIFTSGTATSSFLYGFSYKTQNDATPQLLSVDGTLTALTTKRVGSSSNVPIHTGGLYMRVTWVTANTWAVSWSPDGVSYTDYGMADDTSSYTPTHFGFYVTSGGGTVPTVTAFDYLRVYDSDLSL